jgi:hypothetical protein
MIGWIDVGLSNAAALKELRLEERLFTWSNECAHPTLKKIDRFFVSAEWEVYSVTMIFRPCH